MKDQICIWLGSKMQSLIDNKNKTNRNFAICKKILNKYYESGRAKISTSFFANSHFFAKTTLSCIVALIEQIFVKGEQ
jgi:hypothetical protein